MALKSLKTDTLNTVGDVNGLVHIKTVDFSAVSSETFTGLTGFASYRINIAFTGAGATNILLTGRVSLNGTPASGNDYQRQGYDSTGATLSNITETSTAFTQARLGSADPEKTLIRLDLFNLGLARKTVFMLNCFSFDGTSNRLFNTTGIHNLSNIYNEFQLICSTSNMTGKAYIYGYKD